VTYSLADHQHRFGAWAAARATQRGLANLRTSTISDALVDCGVVAVVDTAVNWPTTAKVFDTAHRGWCRAMLSGLLSHGIDKASYGHAAKAIAIYLKLRVVVGGHHKHAFAKVIHPPIDRILLQGLAKYVRAKDPVFAKQLRTTTWTSLTPAKYDDLITHLRSAGLDQPAFWWIEQFWDPTK
jgi:hypothetical protein